MAWFGLLGQQHPDVNRCAQESKNHLSDNVFQRKLMKRLLMVLALIGTPIQAQSFQELDRVDGWLIERKLTNEQEPICRASMMNGGSWFSARVHLNRNDKLVVPDGLLAPEQASIDAAREALRLCRSDLLYF